LFIIIVTELLFQIIKRWNGETALLQTLVCELASGVCKCAVWRWM